MHIHIVAFNIPYPADYGGVIDIYYRLRALHAMQVSITLHCYAYGRSESDELLKYCDEVLYYQRDMSPWRMTGKKPFIVNSRRSKALLQNLCKDTDPVLFEGVHCTYWLQRLRSLFPCRTLLLRTHNVEQHYYRLLARSERNIFKRAYFLLEARKLRSFEKVAVHASAVLAVTDADAAYFKALGCGKVVTMPSSHVNVSNGCMAETSSAPLYALYHGDLSVGENVRAVHWLACNVFKYLDIDWVVAGRNPVQQVVNDVKACSHARLISNPTQEEMARLVADAQVCLLFTDQPTGLKLKLLNSLSFGKHCLVNSCMVAGTELAEICHVADTPEEFRKKLKYLLATTFDEAEASRRRQLLDTRYNNDTNARLLIDTIVM